MSTSIDDVATIEGRGTQLVSVYVPPEKSIQMVVDRLKREHAEADNIKSKQTRDAVQRALTLAQNELYAVKQHGDGLVVFAGIDSNGNEHAYTFTDVPVSSYRYHCNSTFLTDPLCKSLDNRDRYGLIVIERRAGTIGRLVGDDIQHIRDIESDAKGKHNAGGFSNRRFDRVIEESTENFYDEVAEAADAAFDSDSIEGVIVGGTNITKDDFVSHLPHNLAQQVIGTFRVEYYGNEGLSDLVRRADETITQAGQQTARRAIDTFFTRLRLDDPVVYGRDETAHAAELGAVETLLISDDGNELIEQVEQMGGDVVTVPDTFEAGTRFHEMAGGVGALLRYPVQS
jgi:peptide chain release factor subunit 1